MQSQMISQGLYSCVGSLDKDKKTQAQYLQDNPSQCALNAAEHAVARYERSRRQCKVMKQLTMLEQRRIDDEDEFRFRHSRRHYHGLSSILSSRVNFQVQYQLVFCLWVGGENEQVPCHPHSGRNPERLRQGKGDAYHSRRVPQPDREAGEGSERHGSEERPARFVAGPQVGQVLA